jgi:hypothetical protein
VRKEADDAGYGTPSEGPDQDKGAGQCNERKMSHDEYDKSHAKYRLLNGHCRATNRTCESDSTAPPSETF